ncbi:hypothetical protein JHK87_027569 [Glycine soja]|nr:hypothetical protein JHK87_027569 [Glycine soja]
MVVLTVGGLIWNGNLVVSNAGDCHAVISKEGMAEVLTSDHKPSREDERDKIETRSEALKPVLPGIFVCCFNGSTGSEINSMLGTPLSYVPKGKNLIQGIGVGIIPKVLDVNLLDEVIQYLEEILREAYSHPVVEGIIMFFGPAQVCFNCMTLAYETFINTPAGDVVDNLIQECGTVTHPLAYETFNDMTLA